MDADIAGMAQELERLAARRDFDADTLAKLTPAHIWLDAARALFFLDCLDEPASRDLDPKILILVDEPVQSQMFSEWLMLSNIVHRHLGRCRPGWNGITHTHAGKIRIALRSDFKEAWIHPVAFVPSQTTFDAVPDLVLPDVWDVALFRFRGSFVS